MSNRVISSEEFSFDPSELPELDTFALTSELVTAHRADIEVATYPQLRSLAYRSEGCSNYVAGILRAALSKVIFIIAESRVNDECVLLALDLNRKILYPNAIWFSDASERATYFENVQAHVILRRLGV